jgi:energy-coupling factor transporter ATP-binding protein EcfA2
MLNESDVEQKFAYPLLIADSPAGFGIRPGYIITKANIRRFDIDKGSQKKLYYPDYVVAIAGLPIAVIEAKGPGVALDEAYREARLYAAELNALFSDMNPVSVVCATNGDDFWVGAADVANPAVQLQYEDVAPYSNLMANAQSLLGFATLTDRATVLTKKSSVSRYFKPRRLIGGITVQQEEVGQNSFGATLAAELGHIFNPVTRNDRLRIAREGYVTSPSRERYVAPIDKVIRAATPSWQANSTLIKDTSSPGEIIAPFQSQRELEHRVILLIGEKGAGKTTFLYHLQAVALPDEVRKKTTWVHININDAPVTKSEIYDWVRREIINGIRIAYPTIDFDDFDVIQKIYSVEVNRFYKGIGSLLPPGSSEQNHELYKVLLKCQDDLHTSAVCHTRHFGNERGQTIVVVFDNADKGPRDEQLLMFEVAQWLQQEFRVLVVLPIREETYDNYRDVPPLDTALKDLVFRIEPPVFQQALIKRIQIALDEIANKSERNRTYELSNGFKIKYNETERSYYLASLVGSIFEYDSYARRLILGLAGNNLRRVFEIFVEFCTSGHIGESEILRMRQSKGEYVLPLDVVMTVLLRANRRYYQSDASVIKNICDLEEKDERPTYFSRILILSYLHSNFTEPGPNGVKGYRSLEQILDALSPYGLRFSVIKREIFYLTKANCIIAESLREYDLDESDLFKIGPVGFVHLELLGVAEYWAAIAEDTNFADRAIAKRIADRITLRETQYSHGVSLQNGLALLDYMLQFRERSAVESEAVLSSSRFRQLVNLDDAKDAFDKKSKQLPSGIWYEAQERFLPGTMVDGLIVNVVDTIGLFVEIAPGLTGLLHKSRLMSGAVDPVVHSIGATIRVTVVRIEPGNRRASLSLPMSFKSVKKG